MAFDAELKTITWERSYRSSDGVYKDALVGVIDNLELFKICIPRTHGGRYLEQPLLISYLPYAGVRERRYPTVESAQEAASNFLLKFVEQLVR